MSDQSTNCQSLGFPKTNTRMQFPAATRSAIPKIYGSIVRSDHLLVNLISTSGAAIAAAAGGFATCAAWWLVLFRPNDHNVVFFKADRLLNFCRLLFAIQTDASTIENSLPWKLHTKCMVAVMVQYIVQSGTYQKYCRELFLLHSGS